MQKYKEYKLIKDLRTALFKIGLKSRSLGCKNFYITKFTYIFISMQSLEECFVLKSNLLTKFKSDMKETQKHGMSIDNENPTLKIIQSKSGNLKVIFPFSKVPVEMTKSYFDKNVDISNYVIDLQDEKKPA